MGIGKVHTEKGTFERRLEGGKGESYVGIWGICNPRWKQQHGQDTGKLRKKEAWGEWTKKEGMEAGECPEE